MVAKVEIFNQLKYFRRESTESSLSYLYIPCERFL